jgi:hypothetical protein
MKTGKRISSQLLSLAGEHRVCSELCKRGVFATITPGNRKQTDLYAINDSTKRFVRIEVKASQVRKFVTGISQKRARTGYNAPDFWVLVSFGQGSERFFVLTNDEIEELQVDRNKKWQEGFRARNPGAEFDPRDGVDNLLINDVEQQGCENCWEKILHEVGGAEA